MQRFRKPCDEGSSPLFGSIYDYVSLTGKALAWKARSNRDERCAGSSPVIVANDRQTQTALSAVSKTDGTGIPCGDRHLCLSPKMLA